MDKQSASIISLREAFKHVMEFRTFTIDAMVILPNHLHCLWQLPENDDDFSGRWREIKKYVSKLLRCANRRMCRGTRRIVRENKIHAIDALHFVQHILRA
jgi:REP element-mobilizing transposase RayT